MLYKLVRTWKTNSYLFSLLGIPHNDNRSYSHRRNCSAPSSILKAYNLKHKLDSAVSKYGRTPGGSYYRVVRDDE